MKISNTAFFPTLYPERLKFPITGGELWTRETIEILKKSGVKIKTISPPAFLFKKKILFLLANLWFFLAFLKESHQESFFFFEDSYTHTWNALAHFFFSFFKKIPKIFFVYHLDYPLRPNWIFRLVDKFLTKVYLNQANLLLVDSEQTKIQIEELVGKKNIVKLFFPLYQRLGEDNIFRLRRNRDTAKFASQTTAGIFKLLFVGNCIPRKRLDLLLPILKELGEKAHLDLIGKNDLHKGYLTNITKEINRLELKNVTLHGYVQKDMLFSFYQNADLFVLPSMWEGLGIVLLEAMLSGLPIIAAPTGAIPELVKHGENGFLADPTNTDQWVSYIKQLLDNPEQAYEMGMKGKEIALRYLEESKNFPSALLASIQQTLYP